LALWAWLISLSMTISSSIHFPANDIISKSVFICVIVSFTILKL
jgi:hypothetical protein